jgi:hypothetical protein
MVQELKVKMCDFETFSYDVPEYIFYVPDFQFVSSITLKSSFHASTLCIRLYKGQGMH